jgi:hypothetical protein
MDHREALTSLVPMLGGEVREQDGDIWYTIPTGGYQEAIEVDLDGSPEMPFQVWLRAWDRTHGMSQEEEIGAFTTVHECVVTISVMLFRLDMQYAALENLLTESTDRETE